MAVYTPSLPSTDLAPVAMLSIVIPARDEEENLPNTLALFHEALRKEGILHQIVVVDDGSRDGTWAVLQRLAAQYPELQPVQNTGKNGFGRAVAFGLEQCTGDACAIVMADASDLPSDLIAYWHRLNEGYECVFGSRFMKGGGTEDYPPFKLRMNRLANTFIRVLFRIRFNDFTNAFKIYRREVIRGCLPLISPHFNLTVELPLKAIIRGYTWSTIPIRWKNRTAGEAKLKIKEMGSRYLFITLYLWLEKALSRGDYHRAKKP